MRKMRKGFSLVEMIASTIILPILIIALMSVINLLSEVNRRSATIQRINFESQNLLERIRASENLESLLDGARLWLFDQYVDFEIVIDDDDDFTEYRIKDNGYIIFLNNELRINIMDIEQNRESRKYLVNNIIPNSAIIEIDISFGDNIERQDSLDVHYVYGGRRFFPVQVDEDKYMLYIITNQAVRVNGNSVIDSPRDNEYAVFSIWSAGDGVWELEESWEADIIVEKFRESFSDRTDVILSNSIRAYNVELTITDIDDNEITSFVTTRLETVKE